MGLRFGLLKQVAAGSHRENPQQTVVVD